MILQITKAGLLALFLLCIGCSKENSTPEEITGEEETVEESETNETVRFLALGDSYTIGQGVEISERWPNQLNSKLKEIDINLDETKIIAQTGWKTSNLINAIENNDLSNMSDEAIVSLLIGVNNQFSNSAFDIFESEFNILLDKAILLAGSDERVFVVSIPDYAVTPFGQSDSAQISIEIDMYNEYIENRCDALDIPYINITEISRSLADGDNALALDNLHPSAYQYELWVYEILPIVIEILSE